MSCFAASFKSGGSPWGTGRRLAPVLFYGLTVAVFAVYNIRQEWKIGKGNIGLFYNILCYYVFT
jgi:hypothetical protein